MSEEQPQFKVTDRRLFNADGTPREMAEAEAATETEAAAATANAGENVSSASGAAAETGDTAQASAPEREQPQQAAASTSTPPPASTSGGGESAAREDDEADMLGAEEDVPGVHDPASFINFLMSIASNAAASLGMMEHPVTGERGVDLPLAKHWIDVLGMLEEKTKGNLDPQEARILEGLLSDLRMQFVSLTNTTPATKQKFTGRDIIGGR